MIENSWTLNSFRFDPQTGLLTGTNDGTLVNFFLRNLGRKSEKAICIYLLAFQVIPSSYSCHQHSFLFSISVLNLVVCVIHSSK